MLTLTHDHSRPHLAEMLEREALQALDSALDVILAPWTIDFSHLPWGSQRDETWM